MFVTIFEELSVLIVAAMSSGVAISLIEYIEANDAMGAAASRLGITVSAFTSVIIGMIIIIVVQPLMVRGAGLSSDAIAVVDAAVIPMCLTLLPATLERVLGNMLSAMDAFVGLALTGMSDAAVGVAVFAVLQPWMGVRAYPWASLLKSLVAMCVAAYMVHWADSTEGDDIDCMECLPEQASSWCRHCCSEPESKGKADGPDGSSDDAGVGRDEPSTGNEQAADGNDSANRWSEVEASSGARSELAGAGSQEDLNGETGSAIDLDVGGEPAPGD